MLYPYEAKIFILTLKFCKYAQVICSNTSVVLDMLARFFSRKIT